MKPAGLREVLGRARASIPECLAAGCVDTTTGTLLAVKMLESHSQELLDLVAATTADLFRGTDVPAIGSLLRNARGQEDDGAPYFQEVIVSCDGLLHVFVRSMQSGTRASIFVCRESVNIGMVLSKARLSAQAIEAVE